MGEAVRRIFSKLMPPVVDYDQQLSELWCEWVPFKPTVVDDNSENLCSYIDLALKIDSFYTEYICGIEDHERVNKTPLIDGKYFIYYQLKDYLYDLTWRIKISIQEENCRIHEFLFSSMFMRSSEVKEQIFSEIMRNEENPSLFISKVCDSIEALSKNGLWPDLNYNSSGPFVVGTRCIKELKADIRSWVSDLAEYKYLENQREQINIVNNKIDNGISSVQRNIFEVENNISFKLLHQQNIFTQELDILRIEFTCHLADKVNSLEDSVGELHNSILELNNATCAKSFNNPEINWLQLEKILTEFFQLPIFKGRTMISPKQVPDLIYSLKAGYKGVDKVFIDFFSFPWNRGMALHLLHVLSNEDFDLNIIPKTTHKEFIRRWVRIFVTVDMGNQTVQDSFGNKQSRDQKIKHDRNKSQRKLIRPVIEKLISKEESDKNTYTIETKKFLEYIFWLIKSTDYETSN